MDIGNYKPEDNERFIWLKAATKFDAPLLMGFINKKGKAEIMDSKQLPGGMITGIASVKAVKKGEYAAFTMGVYSNGFARIPAVQVKLTQN
jgi:hypothetical protein